MAEHDESLWRDHWKAWEEEVLLRAREPGATWSYVEPITSKVSRAGKAHRCMSPIRDDGRNPGFYVWDDGGWTDWPSHENGDLYKLVKLHEGLGSHREVMDRLAVLHGLPVWEEKKASLGGMNGASALEADLLAQWEGTYVESAKVWEAMTWLANFAASLLPSMAMDHLVAHYGFSKAYVALRRVGYVPPGFYEAALEESGFSREELLSTGWFHVLSSRDQALCERWGVEGGNDSGVRSAFEDRIVFPYWRSGVCQYAIGRRYSGRQTEDALLPAWRERNAWDEAKYRKLPLRDDEKRPYISASVQNTVLYNEDAIKKARGGELAVTEGVTDCMSLDMIGIAAVSPVTIAFADKDIDRVAKLLRGSGVKHVILCNDNDERKDRNGKMFKPGLTGARKMAAVLSGMGHSCSIAELPKAAGVAKVDVNETLRSVLQERRAA